MKILTIIVPSYNTSEHINRCVPFFLECKQIKKIEIIFINDGSKDDTFEKLATYVAHCPENIRIINKQNGGHGSVINRGIQEANGQYFKVVDGDDWIVPYNIDRLVKDLEKLQADLVLNPYYKESQITGKRMLNGLWRIEKNAVLNFNELPDRIYGLQLHEWTIKTEILRNNHIVFTEKCFYDDFEYITYPIPYIKTICFLDYPVYNYLIDQQNQSVSNKNVYNNCNMSRKIITNVINYYKNLNSDGKASQYLFATLVNGCKQHYNIYLRNPDEKESYDKWKDFDDYLSNNPKIYETIGKKYPYISLIRKYGKSMFLFCSFLLRIYKKIL